MSSLALLPFGSAGDVFPFIWLGRQLKARGHEVTLITACLFEEAARGAGLRFVPLGTRAEFDALTRDPRIWRPYQGTKLVFEWAGRWSEAFCAAVERLQSKPNGLLAPCTNYGARIARESLGAPLITVHLQPSVLLSMHDTPVLFNGMEWMSRLPVWLKRLIFAMPNPADRFAAPFVNAACRSRGVQPPRSLWRDWWDSPDGVLALFPEWFAPPQPDWPQPCHQWSFPLEDLSREIPLDPSLESFLQDGPKPVVFTPGSANCQAAAFFAAAADALKRIGQRGVFVTRHLEQVPAQLPATILAVEYAPFSTLLKHAAAFVHHGGIGTLSQGFAAGVPQLLMPMAHDQPDNEHRLRRLGAGFGIPPKRFNAENVARALRQLLGDPSFNSAARVCAAQIQHKPGPEGMLGWVEQRLERAVVRR